MFLTPKPKDYPPQPGDIERGNPQQDGYAFLLQTAGQCLEQERIREDLTEPHTLAQLAWSAMHGVAGIHLCMTREPSIVWTPVEQLAREAGLTVIQGVARHPGVEVAGLRAVCAPLLEGRMDLERFRQSLTPGENGLESVAGGTES
jgi:hypothetical protein